MLTGFSHLCFNVLIVYVISVYSKLPVVQPLAYLGWGGGIKGDAPPQTV